VNLARAKEIFSGLETRSQITLIGGLVAVIATFFFLYSFASKPSYSTLASNLTPSDTGSAEKALAAAGVTYKTDSGGTQISVLASQLSQARVALAEKGVLNGGHVGFEIFDQSKLGATDFQQKVDYQRALEGEIARTIEQIQGVQSAQVQLVLPDDTLFADEQSKASAAVLVSGGSTLDAATVRGIASLVASSVKGLASDKVTITDETGALLWPTEGSGSGAASAHTKLEADSLYASQVASQINALLTSTLGAGKAIARVHADLNVDQTTVDKVTYGKKSIALQQNLSQETLKSTGGANATLPAGTTTNTNPPGSYAAGANGAGGNSNYNHKTDQTTFGVDKTIQRSVVAPGSVNKLDVALVVDRSIPAAQVTQLQKSVASLAGITPARGDTIAVSRIAFAKQTPAAATKESPVASIMANPLGLAKKVLLGLGALIFLFMMRRALKRREGDPAVPEPTWLREIEGGMTVAELEAAPTMPALPSADVERRDQAREAVEEIANNKPEAIAHQVAAWMKE
jgi:flagellar M-ring protein FliF